MYTHITVEVDAESKVATATLNRPHALNAMTQTMLDDFMALWRQVKADDGINAVVIRANMESRAFTSGADLRGGDDGTDRFSRHETNAFLNQSVCSQLCPKMNYVYKPVITAVHGLCAGAGLFILNESDIVLCSEDAQFFDPHMAIGIVSAQGPIGMLRRVNLGEVLRYTLLSNAERLTAETAQRIGLVTEVTSREALWGRADEIARIVASYEAIAVQGTLRATWESLEMGRKAALDRAQIYADASRSGGATRPAHTPAKKVIPALR